MPKVDFTQKTLYITTCYFLNKRAVNCSENACAMRLPAINEVRKCIDYNLDDIFVFFYCKDE